MPRFNKRGNRIRASDKSLVFRFSAGSLLLLFLTVVMLLNLKSIITTDWKAISLFQDSSVHLSITPYRIVTIVVAALACMLAALFYRRFQYDKVKQLFHRQKLARMLLKNGWYESESTQDSGFFKDLSATTKKEKITYFPKLYYRMEHGLLYIRTEITLGKYQEQLLHLEKKLETGLYCELVSKELKDSYVEYVLLYDTIANRITIDEVQAEHGSLRLMKNVWWEYDKLPHMLIAGGTGGGKTYFILTLIEALLRCNAVMYILDPKNADLADLSIVMPEVWYKKEDITACIDRFYDGMMARSESMKLMENYRTGENYAYFGLAPHFLIFDEYVVFMEMLTTKENAAVFNKLKQIVMLGRQAGYFLILACQRPDAKYLGDGIRDQFNFRVALGRMSELSEVRADSCILIKTICPWLLCIGRNIFNTLERNTIRCTRSKCQKSPPHVCRHTFCSNMAKSGMNPKTLQYIMGHGDIGVTLNTYTHVKYEDAKREMVGIEELKKEGALRESGNVPKRAKNA